MDNPVLVEVTRGNTVESRHRGSIAIVDADGKLAFGAGDVEQGIFARSAIKALQAIPMVESGAAEALNFDDAELALACASHNGEDVHAKSARMMLFKAGLTEQDLMCGPQWPKHMDDCVEIVKTDDSPCQLHNNCSGKHAGFLAMAKTLGIPTENYIDFDHPVQAEIRNVLEQMSGGVLAQDVCGTDGCSIPTYAMDQQKTALAFARFATGVGLDPVRANAAEVLYEACVNEPYMVAGKNRFCTEIMDIFKGRVFVKVGAEGVFCAALPELGFGVTLKCEDGSVRGAEVMMAATIRSLLGLSEEEEKGLRTWEHQQLKNRRDILVGEVRPVADFKRLLNTI
ncbi:asparaginase [Pseudovibrio denitrificans]|uniref:Asparaginase n=1 Tax=Pseudovibrio denitrificans TaxID=258256 RepID=A0A1I6YGP3_9HYPH|nr:asparaginase [Pseudovibrio denitrificans]SFT49477.1 asparaginase [Pseudovibrio denitrificans]